MKKCMDIPSVEGIISFLEATLKFRPMDKDIIDWETHVQLRILRNGRVGLQRITFF